MDVKTSFLIGAALVAAGVLSSSAARELAADAALAQCREKRYADAYRADGRRVVYVGVNYDPEARTISAVRTDVAIETEGNAMFDHEESKSVGQGRA